MILIHIFFLLKMFQKQHRGHQSFKEDVESHFEIIIVSEKFHNKNKIQRHRIVNEVLKEEFLSDLHSVTIESIFYSRI